MNLNRQRRVLLKGLAAVGALAALPGAVLASAWPKEAFESKVLDEALSKLLGGSTLTESSAISIKAPEIAENGAVVPVTVSAELEGAESISIIAQNNPVPLVAHFKLGDGALAYAATRIKMGKTGDVIAVVKVGDKLYSAAKNVKVTIGGCGG